MLDDVEKELDEVQKSHRLQYSTVGCTCAVEIDGDLHFQWR